MSTTTKNLGRVSIVPKGEWSSNSTYTRLDLVTYNGSSYIAKKDVPINIQLNNDEYWMVTAQKGDMGDPLVFLAIYNQTEFGEIAEAEAAGKVIVAREGGFLTSEYYALAKHQFGADIWGDLDQYVFSHFIVDEFNNYKKSLRILKCRVLNGRTYWETEQYPIELAEEEFKSYVDTKIADLNLQNLSQLEYEVIT